MTYDPHNQADDPHAAASAWVVRLHQKDVSEADWLEFDAWLWASRENEVAYDQALSLWREIDANAAGLREAGTEPVIEAAELKQAPRVASRWRPAIAAAVAASLIGGLYLATGLRPGGEVAYATVPGEARTVKLEDGTRVDLRGGSRITVSFAHGARRVTMGDAEAVFDVAKDAHRPFLITVGDRTVRVVGTQFDVRRREGQVAVSVGRGLVEVEPLNGPFGAVRLSPGQRLDHAEGQAASQITAINPQDAFAWRAGRLVYHDRPLSEVAADLSAQYARPVRIADPALAQRRFSGVLVLGKEDDVVRRLAELASISSADSKDGIVLRL